MRVRLLEHGLVMTLALVATSVAEKLPCSRSVCQWAAASGRRLGQPGYINLSRRRLGRIVCCTLSSGSSKGIHVNLVMDINKTIYMEDPAGGKTTRQLVNEVISEVAWGRVEGKTWTSAGLDLGVHQPAPQLVSYSDYVHQTYPDVEGGDLRAMKQRRDSLKGTFTDAGAPGGRYAQDHQTLTQRLEMPKGLNTDLMKAAGLEGRRLAGLLPAFLHFLQQLEKRRLSAPPSSPFAYSLQFRTFGTDARDIIREHNALCRELHPLLPGFCLGDDGADFTLDLGRDRESYGCMYRDDDGCVLVLGTLQHPSSRADVERLERVGHKTITSLQEIHEFLMSRHMSRHPTMFIQDYWPFWRKNLEAAWAGKLIVVPRAEQMTKWHTVVFDDNIENDDAHIIDLRYTDGATVPFQEALGKHLVRVEPFLALLHPQTYFMQTLDRCLKSADTRHHDCSGSCTDEPND